MAIQPQDISFSCDPQVQSALSAGFSSDQVCGGICDTFFLIDATDTLGGRLWKVPDDQAGNGGIGAPLAFTSTHPAVALGFTISLLCVAALNGYRIYRNMKHANKIQSHQYIAQVLLQAQKEAYNAKSIEEKKQIAKEVFGEISDEENQLVDAVLEKKFEGESEEENQEIINLGKQIETDACQYMLDRSLEKMRLSDKELRDKYDGIYYNVEKNTITFKPKKIVTLPTEPEPVKSEPAPETWFSWINRKILSPVYGFLGLSSFAYWLMWFGAAVFTGQFDVGIVGVPNWLAFGIPFGVGLLYPGFKIANYFSKKSDVKNIAARVKDEEPATDEQIKAAAKDAPQVMRRLIQRLRFDQVKESLLQELNEDEYQAAKKFECGIDSKQDVRSAALEAEVAYLTQDLKKKTAMAFTSDLAGTYVGLQYGSWIVCDFLTKVANVTAYIPIVNLIAGISLFVVSGIHAVYKAVISYQDRLAGAQQAREALAQAKKKQGDFLESLYFEKLKHVNGLKAQLGVSADLPEMPVEFDQSHFLSDITPGSQTESTPWRKNLARAMVVVDQFMTGAFIARMFFVKATAIFLPFAAAAFCNPITIGIVIGMGLAWAAYKLWEHDTKCKEQLAAEALKNSAERIEYWKEKVKLVDLSARVLEHRVTNMSQPAPINSKEEICDVNDSRKIKAVAVNKESQEPVSSSSFWLERARKEEKRISAWSWHNQLDESYSPKSRAVL